LGYGGCRDYGDCDYRSVNASFLPKFTGKNFSNFFIGELGERLLWTNFIIIIIIVIFIFINIIITIIINYKIGLNLYNYQSLDQI
jgi:hypothetical protein